jgi:hypothetical protein
MMTLRIKHAQESIIGKGVKNTNASPELNPYPKSAHVAVTIKARIWIMSFKCMSMPARSDLHSSTLISIVDIYNRPFILPKKSWKNLFFNHLLYREIIKLLDNL